MLNELTPAQEKLMHEVREEWLAKIFDPTKRLKLDKEKAKESIEWLYSFCSLKKPKVVFSRSPIDSQRLAKTANVWDNVGANVGANVWANVGANVRANVWDNVGANVWANVGDNVRANVGDNVWANVRANVGANVGDRYFFPSDYGRIDDYGWCSFYDFFSRIGIVKDKNFDLFLSLLDSGVYELTALDGLCVACPMPTEIHRTDPTPQLLQNRKLHSLDGMAIKWEDGYGQHYLHGVYFDEDLWSSVVDSDCDLKRVMAIENMEQRMAAIKTIGYDKLLDDSDLLHSSERGNHLHLVKGVFEQDAYFLRYKDPSTDRIYVSGIDPQYAKENADADSCMAWKFNMTPEEYSELKVEA